MLRRARLAFALAGDVTSAVSHGLSRRKRRPGRVRLICFIDLAQDADVLLPVAVAARDSGRFDVRVVATHWLNYAAPHVPERIEAAGFAAERPTRQAILSGIAPMLRGWDALLTASESTSPSHRVSHALTRRAEAHGVPTFTLQHGLENVGLTYAGDGPHDFASRMLFIWGDPARLPHWVASDLRARCVGVGRPRALAPSEAPRLEDTRPVAAVFENLHWKRYDDAYRARFIADLMAAAAANPDMAFVVKPHPAGRWLTEHAARFGPMPANLNIADPALSSDALIARAAAVITTPSTIALDAAQNGAPVAVAAYGLDLASFAPLRLLENGDDWRRFLATPQVAEAGDAFVARHVLANEDAAAAILAHIAEYAAKPAPARTLTQRAKTLAVHAARAVAPFAPDPSPRLVEGGLGTLARVYRRWIAAYDAPSEADLAALRTRPAADVRVVIDAYGASETDIQRTETSLRAQTLAPRDIRIERDAVGAVRAQGDFFCVIAAGDVLAPHALSTLVAGLERAPTAPFAYSDEDWLAADGSRRDPYFKPDWSWDRFLAQDYASPLALVRTALLREPSASVYEMLLRLAASGTAPVHAPHVLIHRARGPNGDALAAAAEAARAHSGATAVEQREHGVRRLAWPLPTPAPLVSLIVPTRDHADLLNACVTTLLRTDYPAIEVLIVDNESREPATLACFDRLAKDGRVRVLHYPHAFNFAAINNFAAAQANGALIGLVNNDVEADDPEWLREMVSHAVRPGVGAVGALLRYPDGTIQHAGCVLGMGGVAGHVFEGWPGDALGHGARLRMVQDVSAVTAACLLTRAEVWREMGGLDEAFPVAYNDIDFCLRLRRVGHRVLWTPHARLVHRQSASRGADRDGERRARLEREKAAMRLRWGAALLNDPFYSPNLSLADADCRPAFPPRTPRPWD